MSLRRAAHSETLDGADIGNDLLGTDVALFVEALLLSLHNAENNEPGEDAHKRYVKTQIEARFFCTRQIDSYAPQILGIDASYRRLRNPRFV